MSEVKLPETVAYCREWDGDSSDIGNMLVEFNENDLDDGEWTKLCTVQSAEEYAEQRVREALELERANSVRIKAEQIHYPEHWDITAYPTLESAVHEFGPFRCSECKP